MTERVRQSRATGAKKIREARAILDDLEVPKGQRNDRSALALLVLLGITPKKRWADAGAPLLGITEMMDRFLRDFRWRYAPNSRETVRRSTIHQFVQMGMVLANPDEPKRAINSPDNRYQVSPALLHLARQYGSTAWGEALNAFLGTTTLGRLQPKDRPMARIPVKLPSGRTLKLTAGGQNELVRAIVEEFCPRFTPGGVVLYVGDTGKKDLHYEREAFAKLGLMLDRHGKMPDVVVHLPDKNWLVLIEVVTSHGPIGLKRHNELKDLFATSKAGLVFVTAFLTRRAMTKYLAEIAWETEVWVAEAPSHIIHFNGERFLGPYGQALA